jgi:hypothetical protein
VVTEVTNEDVRNITDAALPVGVILAGAHLPVAVIIDMGFPRWVLEAQGPSRDDRDGVLEVGDPDKPIQFAVDEIGERLVSYLEIARRRWDGTRRIRRKRNSREAFRIRRT